MQWLIAFHVIFVVCWFSGLFYLPRLFVYHAACTDEAGNQRFKVMERKLYYFIMTPSGILATILGLSLWLPRYDYYAHMNWLHIKLILVLLLWLYHGICGYWVLQFKRDKNQRSEKFFRIFNELPTLMLITIVILSFVKP